MTIGLGFEFVVFIRDVVDARDETFNLFQAAQASWELNPILEIRINLTKQKYGFESLVSHRPEVNGILQEKTQ